MHTLTELQALIEKAIAQINYPSYPKKLYDPIGYIMNLSGKRIRPVLVLMACELFTDKVEQALDVALAIETFHNFTLIHDDIMDNALLRRGKATVHGKWGINNAILSGDALMIEANKHLSKVDLGVLKPVLSTFNITAQKVCEGQQLDMEFETKTGVSIDEYIEMIRLKTAVLLGGALKLGAIVGGASIKDADLLYQFGENLGIVFQLQDDILDVYGDPNKFGKQVGGDIISNKKTFLHLKTLELAETEEANLLTKSGLNHAEKIYHVTDLYNKYAIKQRAENEIQQYLDAATKILHTISVADEKKNEFRILIKQIIAREN